MNLDGSTWSFKSWAARGLCPKMSDTVQSVSFSIRALLSPLRERGYPLRDSFVGDSSGVPLGSIQVTEMFRVQPLQRPGTSQKPLTCKTKQIPDENTYIKTPTNVVLMNTNEHHRLLGPSFTDLGPHCLR